MALILTSNIGGIPDPYVGLDGVTEALTFPNAAIDDQDFNDRIILTPDPYVSVVSSDLVGSRSSITPSYIPQSTISGGSTLNITYEQASIGSVSFGGSIQGTGGPDPKSTGFLAFSMKLRGTFFTDKYMEYKDRSNGNAIVRVTSFDDVPSQNAEIYLFKPSFIKYVFYTYTVKVEYLTSSNTIVTVQYTVLKRVLNDWDADRVALKAKVAAQNASSN